MKTIKFLSLPFFFIIYLLIALPFQSCEPDKKEYVPNDGDNEIECDTCNMVRKPNIYIYPGENTQLTVKLTFPMGGEIVTSIPEYGTGWNISVDQNGLIDNTYSYLFYESIQPNIWQKDEGWIIEKMELETFFRDNMIEYGFEGQEIEDFIDYWIPRLDDFLYYSVFPQTSEIIDNVIELEFSKQPDNMLRLFYVVKGYNQIQEELIEPTIDSFNREGYFVTEWGVILN